MFRSAGSSQPAGCYYAVFGHLLNRDSRTSPPITSPHYVGRVISHQFLYVFFLPVRYRTCLYQSGVHEYQCTPGWCSGTVSIRRSTPCLVRSSSTDYGSGVRCFISSVNPPYHGDSACSLTVSDALHSSSGTMACLVDRYLNRGFMKNISFPVLLTDKSALFFTENNHIGIRINLLRYIVLTAMLPTEYS